MNIRGDNNQKDCAWFSAKTDFINKGSAFISSKDKKEIIILIIKPICKKLIITVCNIVPVGLLLKTEVKAEHESIKNNAIIHPIKTAVVFIKELFI